VKGAGLQRMHLHCPPICARFLLGVTCDKVLAVLPQLVGEDKLSEVGKSGCSEGKRSHHRERSPPQRHPKFSSRQASHPDSFCSDGRVVHLKEPANRHGKDYEGCDSGKGFRCHNGSILRSLHFGPTVTVAQSRLRIDLVISRLMSEPQQAEDGP
jgi:hypothetical protein